MEQQHYKTIIIGGGISGLACARTLHDAGEDFLLITKDVGGRMKCDEKTGIHLGAGLVTSDYKYVLKYIDTRPTESSGQQFLCDTECHSLRQIIVRNLVHLPKLLTILFFAWKFYRHINAAKRRMPFESLKKIAEGDPFLSWTFKTPATDFVRSHKLEELTEKYISPLIASGLYTEANEVNTFYYLYILSGVFAKMYTPDFSNALEKLTKGFEQKICIDRVVKVTRPEDVYEIETVARKVTAEYIVFAAPEESLRDIYPLPKPYIQQQVHRFIIRGQRKEEYLNKALTFNPKHHHLFKMTEAKPGYDLISARNGEPDFERYYDDYEIVTHLQWQPAVMIPKAIIDQNLGDNAYLASDYNSSTLEDAFLAGLYAANQIIEKSVTG